MVSVIYMVTSKDLRRETDCLVRLTDITDGSVTASELFLPFVRPQSAIDTDSLSDRFFLLFIAF